MGAKANYIRPTPSYASEPADLGSIDTLPAQNGEARGIDAAEVVHRMTNMVTVIQSISRLTMRHCSTMAEFNEKFSSRLSSLCISLDRLIDNAWREMSVHDLVHAQLERFGMVQGQITANGPVIFLTPEGVHYLGLALHELITNAVKHGSLSVLEGRVELMWSNTAFAGQARFRITWVEVNGPLVREPTHQGFGRLLIETHVGTALHGVAKCAFPATGFRWELDAPQFLATGETEPRSLSS